jgi:hypothetical protein
MLIGGGVTKTSRMAILHELRHDHPSLAFEKALLFFASSHRGLRRMNVK